MESQAPAEPGPADPAEPGVTDPVPPLPGSSSSDGIDPLALRSALLGSTVSAYSAHPGIAPPPPPREHAPSWTPSVRRPSVTLPFVWPGPLLVALGAGTLLLARFIVSVARHMGAMPAGLAVGGVLLAAACTLRWYGDVAEESAAGTQRVPDLPDFREIEETLDTAWTWASALFFGLLPAGIATLLGIRTAWVIVPLCWLGLIYLPLAYTQIRMHGLSAALPPRLLAWALARPTVLLAATGFALACLPAIILSLFHGTPWVLFVASDGLLAAAFAISLAHIGRRVGMRPTA